jgi:hypothetical protein
MIMSDEVAFQGGRGLGNFLQGFIAPMTTQDAGGNAEPPTFAQRWLSGQRATAEGGRDYVADADKAKALRQVVAAYAQDEPDEDKQKQIVAASHSMGLGDLEGFVQAHASRMSDMKQKADIAEQWARGDYYKDFAAARQQQAQDGQTTGAFLQNYLTAPKEVDPDTGDTTDMAPEDRLKYAAKNTPGLSGRHMPQIMDALANWNKVQAGTDPDAGVSTTFDEDPVTGNRFASRGKQIMPSGVDPSKQPTEPVYSPDGKMFWNGKQWSELKQLGFPDGATIKTINGVNAVVDGKGKILKTVGTQSAGQALADALNGGQATPPAGARPPAAAANEVTRFTSDGRKAIFDAKTKQFLRYAN